MNLLTAAPTAAVPATAVVSNSTSRGHHLAIMLPYADPDPTLRRILLFELELSRKLITKFEYDNVHINVIERFLDKCKNIYEIKSSA